MSKNFEKQKTLELRKLGKSYSQIKKEIKVSKSTLTRWLSKYPLKKEQVRQLRDINEKKIEKYRTTMKKKREIRMQAVEKNMSDKWNKLSNKDFEISGLFLYWGEGNKGAFSSISLSNSDPKMLLFFKKWLIKIFHVSEDRFKIYLHLYQDMNIQQELIYWSKILSIPMKQFSRPYIKESKLSQLTHKGFGHGTCNMTVNDTRLKEKIITSIKVIVEMELNTNKV